MGLALAATNAYIFFSSASDSAPQVELTASGKTPARADVFSRAAATASPTKRTLVEVAPGGVPSGLRRGEILPGEKLVAALSRAGIPRARARRLTEVLGGVVDLADIHAGDTFVAQTDSRGQVLWFELKTLRGEVIGARRDAADLVGYRKDASARMIRSGG